MALFVERVEDYRAVVTRCAPDDLGSVVAEALGAARAVVPPALGLEVAGSVVDVGLTAAELDRLDAVVTRARVGIAETGTIVLDHGPDQGRRAISLVPDLHVCIVDAAQVVADVPDAIAAARPRPPDDVDQRTVGHERHRARPGRGCPRPAHAARRPRRLTGDRWLGESATTR